jgi:cytochrome c oxidase subunit IV
MSETLGEDDLRYLKRQGVHITSRSALVLLRAGLLLLLLGWISSSLEQLWKDWLAFVMTPQCSVAKMATVHYPACVTSYLWWFRWQYSERLWLVLVPDNWLAIAVVHCGGIMSSFRGASFAGLGLVGKILLPPIFVGILVPLVATLALTRFSLRFRLNGPLSDDFGEGFRVIRLLFIWIVSAGLLYWCVSIFVPLGLVELQGGFEMRELRLKAYVTVLNRIGGAMLGLSVVVQLCAFIGYRIRYKKLLPILRQKYGE